MTETELNTLVDQLEDIFGLDDFQSAFPGNHRMRAKEVIRTALAKTYTHLPEICRCSEYMTCAVCLGGHPIFRQNA